MSWSSFDSRASPFLTCWRILAYQDPLCQMVHLPWSNLDKTMGSSCTERKFLVLLKAQQQISAFQGCETEESYSLIRFLVCFCFLLFLFLSLRLRIFLLVDARRNRASPFSPRAKGTFCVGAPGEQGQLARKNHHRNWWDLFQFFALVPVCCGIFFCVRDMSLLSSTAVNYRPLS